MHVIYTAFEIIYYRVVNYYWSIRLIGFFFQFLCFYDAYLFCFGAVILKPYSLNYLLHFLDSIMVL